jgi:hypothetical protein
MAPGFVPESKFDSVPESELVIDDTKIVLDDMFGGADGVGDFSVLETFGNKFDDSILSIVGYSGSVPLICVHSCLR